MGQENLQQQNTHYCRSSKQSPLTLHLEPVPGIASVGCLQSLSPPGCTQVAQSFFCVGFNDGTEEYVRHTLCGHLNGHVIKQ